MVRAGAGNGKECSIPGRDGLDRGCDLLVRRRRTRPLGGVQHSVLLWTTCLELQQKQVRHLG